MSDEHHRPKAYELTLLPNIWDELEEHGAWTLVVQDVQGVYHPTDALMLYSAGEGNEHLAILALIEATSRPQGLLQGYVLLAVKVVATRDAEGWE